MGNLRPPMVSGRLGDVTTDRMTLRRFSVADIDDLAGVFAKREVWRFPYGRAFDRYETEAFVRSAMDHWDQCGFGLWLARDGDNDRVLGYVGLSVPMFMPEILPAVEVGWRFDPDVWGRGLATEGARAALAEGFKTLGLEEITSIPQFDNPASVAVCERLGMRLDRHVELAATDRRGAVVAALHRMTVEEWRAAGSVGGGAA